MREPMDVGEVAQDYQDKHNAAALAAHRAKISNQMAGPSLEICMDCGDDIPEDRREAQQGCTRCAECQTLSERLGGGI
jgi:phage/conjugal plasmid C-4 type zinc finger TraR family protein